MTEFARIDDTVFQPAESAGSNTVRPVVDIERGAVAGHEDVPRGQTLRGLRLVDEWSDGSADFVLLGGVGVELIPTALETLLWALDADEELAFATALVGSTDGDATWNIDVAKRAGFAAWRRRTGSDWPVMLVRRSVLQEGGGLPSGSLGDCRSPKWKGIRVGSVLFGIPGLRDGAQGDGERDGDVDDGWLEAFPQPKPRARFYRELRWNAPGWNPLTRREPAGSGTGRRILQILPFLEMGGADKFALDVTEWLQREAGAHVSVVTTDPGANRWLPRMRELTADVFDLTAFLPEIEQPTFVSEVIESRGIDTVLVTHSFAGYRMLPYLRTRHPGVALVDYLHVEHQGWRNGGYPRASILYRDHLDLTISSSRHLRDWVEQRGHRSGRQAVCHTNIDAESWRRESSVAAGVRREFGVTDDQVLVLFAARMVYQKQPKLLAEIILSLEADHPELDFVCLAAGDGDDLPWLENFVRVNGLERLRLIGARSNADVKRLLAAADVYLLPSMMEGIALALFEAMAMECVVVAGDVGGQGELVEEGSGFLIDRQSGSELKSYVDVLRRVIADRALREKVQERARQRIVEEFSIRRMAECLAAALDRAHDLRRGSPNPVLSESVIRHLLAEAVELQRLDAETSGTNAGLKSRFEDRLEKRDRRIERLQAKVTKLEGDLREARRRRSLRQRLGESLRKRWQR